MMRAHDDGDGDATGDDDDDATRDTRCVRGIRDSMGCKVDGAVVILDEAHNVEGVARDAGSFEVVG